MLFLATAAAKFLACSEIRLSVATAKNSMQWKFVIITVSFIIPQAPDTGNIMNKQPEVR